MDVGDDGMSVGNNITGVRDLVTNIGNCYMRVDGKFGLETDGQQRRWRGDRTYVKNVKDPVEVKPPGRNRVFVVFCAEEARNYIALALLDDHPLDLCHGPAITCVVRQPSKPRTTGLTHVVNWFIASHTD